MKTQAQMYYEAEAKRGRLNEAVMDMIRANDLTKEELETLISKRPNVYGHLRGLIQSLPSGESTRA